jgi:hypothetical protein
MKKKSKYVGVSWHEKWSKWQVTAFNGVSNEYVGAFKNEKMARKSYLKAINLIKKK